jgi:geranylgeranyl diphosphate synthase type II
MAAHRERVDRELDDCLPRSDERPGRLHEAMRYSVFAGGKRVRPITCMAGAEAVGGDAEVAVKPAAAVECLHTYTLIHDDLPAMDDDDLRRGRPTSHKVYGEANAILAGDALLTLAFEILAAVPVPAPYPPGALGRELAHAAGSRGVAGGQYEDLAAENGALNEELLEFIHVNKTAKLIRASVRMGAIAAGASEEQLAALSDYGDAVGLAFQVADDVLNETSSAEHLGKAVGSDHARGKVTYVALHGIQGARERANQMVERALSAVAVLGDAAEPLRAIARFIVDRTN